jgi:TnpA family transposase
LPHKAFAVEHIGELFSDTIEWQLIETHLPDMLRVALSISQGKIRSSTILRRLGTYGRKKNKVYLGFRELGRVVRTVFLLNFVSDPELRRTITAATNTSEAWNTFIQWVAFGGDGIIRENSRDEQRKIIRYNHLVANLLVFHNVVSMTRALQELIDEGYPVTEEIIARLAPYRTDHINRFGSYELKFDQVPEPIAEDLQL